MSFTERAEWRAIVHDHGHGAMSVVAHWLLTMYPALLWYFERWTGVAFTELQLMIGVTIGFGLLHEIVWDGWRRGRWIGFRRKDGTWSVDSLHDPLTYLWPWAPYAAGHGDWWTAFVVLLAYEGFVLWWTFGGSRVADRLLNRKRGGWE